MTQPTQFGIPAFYKRPAMIAMVEYEVEHIMTATDLLDIRAASSVLLRWAAQDVSDGRYRDAAYLVHLANSATRARTMEWRHGRGGPTPAERSTSCA